ncbi:MAG TPA: UDP-2,3-diacylglucosamine diphosphatase LpxI [Pseudolabrys sp.]|nr:UDP-2,3-diacylglucosamine diphosphatase LpxI [Pseudolabrys sp.]
MSNAVAVGQDGPLAMICGGGTLPLAVADSAAKRGRNVVLFPLRGHADAALTTRYPHHWLRIGQLGAFTRLARAADCRDVVFIGALVRPSLWSLRPDLLALKSLPKIIQAYRGGDNHLLTGVSKLFEEQGFRLVGAHEVAPEILVPEGALGRIDVSEQERADIAFGFDYLQASGAFDVGQAVVVAGKRILAVEAAEGTDQMLDRVAELRASGRIGDASGTGVLVKAPKPDQDQRFDLPSIGPRTVTGVVGAGLAGIAVVSAKTIIADAESVVREADRAGIFVVGVPSGSKT